MNKFGDIYHQIKAQQGGIIERGEKFDVLSIKCMKYALTKYENKISFYEHG